MIYSSGGSIARPRRVVLQVLNFLAGGRDIASGVSYVCQGIIRGPAAPLVKRLAYDVVHAAALTDADWANVIEGLKSDLAGTFSLEVRMAVPCRSCSAWAVLALRALQTMGAAQLATCLSSGHHGGFVRLSQHAGKPQLPQLQ